MRASPAISFGDSMRQMASMLRWMSVVMTVDHSSIHPSRQVQERGLFTFPLKGKAGMGMVLLPE
jgi:hypothetical protein